MKTLNPREKLLAVVIGGFVLLVAGGLGIRLFFISPLKKIDKEIDALKTRQTKINNDRREYFKNEDYIKSLARKSFGLQVDQASAKSGEMLTAQLAAAGLNDADFTRLPVGPKKLRGASEIGWNVTGKGSLQQMVNLLYLLEHSPYLHKIENLIISTDDKPGKVRARFHYLTLVIDTVTDVKLDDLKWTNNLAGPDRKMLNIIAQRDILRPYIKRPPPPPPPPGANPATHPAAPTTAPKGPGPENFKLVSLSEWNGQPEVHIRDVAGKKTISYKPGDTLDGGTIVAIDYRPLPFPKNPDLLSESRVILKIGDEYWAIERGQTLAEKRRLDKDQWPIASISTAQPGGN